MTDSGTKHVWAIHERKAVPMHVHNTYSTLTWLPGSVRHMLNINTSFFLGEMSVDVILSLADHVKSNLLE